VESRAKSTTKSPRKQSAAPAADSAAPVRGARRGLVEAQIMEEATRLFADRGFAGTSLQDIAEATGLTRPALYHYFGSKDDLLFRLVSELAEGPAEQLEQILTKPETPASERLREMAFAVAFQQASHPARFRLMVRSENELPENLSTTYAQARRRVLHAFSSVIDEGVRTGELRPVDPRTSALGIIGLCNWVAWWHHPEGERAETAVAEGLAEMAVASVMAQDNRPAEGDGAARALQLLKQDLAMLERALTE
jgi:AcrR family transcriptional regulator